MATIIGNAVDTYYIINDFVNAAKTVFGNEPFTSKQAVKYLSPNGCGTFVSEYGARDVKTLLGYMKIDHSEPISGSYSLCGVAHISAKDYDKLPVEVQCFCTVNESAHYRNYYRAEPSTKIDFRLIRAKSAAQKSIETRERKIRDMEGQIGDLATSMRLLERIANNEK